ncbi:MAG: GNAT family N-acetyltransferase [Clostridiales bacterium]|jgi:predicted GNAT family N-acyltransferase|nr:GNAT family N-acetyltransferase [Clostridiales bacterium]
MIDLTPQYLISQAFVLSVYVLICITFFAHKSKTILWLNTASNFLYIIGFFLLGAYSGMAAVAVAFVRNCLVMLTKSEKSNSIITWLSIVALAICGYFTFNGIFSTFIIIATMLYSYAICQKNVLTYKKLNVIISLLRLIYNIFVFSIIGIIFELCLLISVIIGVTKHINDKQITTKIGGYDELYNSAYSVREKVFVNEDNEVYDFGDDIDKIATHFVLFDGDNPIATARLFFKDNVYQVGRVAVLREYQGQKLGAKVMQELLEFAQKQAIDEVHLHSQCHAQGFYEKLGFTSYGDIFQEANIDHISMVWREQLS